MPSEPARGHTGVLGSVLLMGIALGCLASPGAWAGGRTARITLMALGDNRVADLEARGRYDGIQLDNVSTESPFRPELVGKWISATPVALTPAQWTADDEVDSASCTR